MKLLIKRLLAVLTLIVCVQLMAVHGPEAIAPCAIILFAATAIIAPHRAWKLGAAPDSNDVASALNLSEILDSALESFKRAILPLTVFATTFRNVPLRGNDMAEVRYYPLQGIKSKDFNGRYNTKAGGGSMTDVRQIPVTKRKYQPLEITGYTLARIPMFDAVRMGRLKGEALASDIIQDILSIVTPTNFPSVAFTGAPSSFDADNVVDIRTACNKNTTGVASVADAVTTTGSTTLTSATAGFIPSDIGSAISGAGIPDGTFIDGIVDIETLMGTPGTGIILSQEATATATGVTINMVRPIIPWPKNGRGLILDSDYDGALLKDNSFRRDLTLAQERTIITGLLPNVYGFDYAETAALPNISNLVGLVTYMSGILVAFSPIEPPPAVRARMTQYEIVTDKETGISLEYRVWGDPDSDTEKHTIEANYGFAIGEQMAIKRLVSA